MEEKALIDQTWLVHCCKCLQWASFKSWIKQLLHWLQISYPKRVRSRTLCKHGKIQRAGSFEFNICEEEKCHKLWCRGYFLLVKCRNIIKKWLMHSTEPRSLNENSCEDLVHKKPLYNFLSVDMACGTCHVYMILIQSKFITSGQ